MKRTMVVVALFLSVAPYAVAAEGSENRSLAVCKAVNGLPENAALTNLTDDELKEKLCMSSLSVVRSADATAGMQCRLAFKVLFGEFSRRHPRKEMSEVYGRC